jgi:hypothetical protein
MLPSTKKVKKAKKALVPIQSFTVPNAGGASKAKQSSAHTAVAF